MEDAAMAIAWLAAHFGVPVALLICALLSLMVVEIGWIWRRPAEKGLAASSGW